MEILKPNSGQSITYIVNSNVYVKVWDYGKKYLLSHLKIPHLASQLSETVWVWNCLNEGSVTDVNEFGHSSFDDAINRAVNNPYCTVYSFESYEEMAKHWNDIKYVDTITTTYKAKSDD